MSRVGVVIVAAGKGSRMKSAEHKQYLNIKDKPILLHTLEAFQRSRYIDHMTVVVGASDVERVKGWVHTGQLHKVEQVLAGGRERQESVYLGLTQLPADIEWVLVHDGVRPFITSSGINDCLEAARQYGAAVPAVPVKDTIKKVGADQVIVETPERQSLWAVQTPQAFRASHLLAAHEAARKDGFTGTDDASLLERMDEPVKVVMGDYRNIKITTPEDLSVATQICDELAAERATEQAERDDIK
ncbi:2-C-methyl-D-erythritol 4-phosphate cytidylyltransferase [Marinicrinis sediminis]|uniref:2-C-methyl-D-erythritol 4-phosphate cytidylyltransferase n=1 Tax=Marinicrinis sediminis TaxID=1652465 RepID=A0ABW5RBP6_9BACL